MDQKNIRTRLKIAKIEDNDFSYSDIADMLDIKVGSVYNFLNGAFNLSQKKAKYLDSWLSDKGFQKGITEE